MGFSSSDECIFINCQPILLLSYNFIFTTKLVIKADFQTTIQKKNRAY
jgi:hypothetical protein